MFTKIPQDFANCDRAKVKRIMKKSGNVFHLFPKGIIKTPDDLQG